MQVRVITLFAICLLAFAGCAQKVVFEGSPLLPAADAEVKVSVDRNENTLVELALKHVAPAQRLSPPKLLYVVWAESEEGRLFQLGQLRVNEDREGHFTGTAPLERLRLVITAENEPRPEKPHLPYMLVTEFFAPSDGPLR